MNLHEECLLKFLLNPLDLSQSTELLKQNNILLEKNLFSINNVLSKKTKVKYSVTRF